MSYGRELNNNTGRMEWNLEDIFTAENLYKEERGSSADLPSILSLAHKPSSTSPSSLSTLDSVTNDNNTLATSPSGILNPQSRMSWNSPTLTSMPTSPPLPQLHPNAAAVDHPKLEHMINDWLKEKDLLGPNAKKRKSTDEAITKGE